MKKKIVVPSVSTSSKHRKLVAEIEQQAIPWRVSQVKDSLFKIQKLIWKIDDAFKLAADHLEILDAYADKRLSTRKGDK